MNKNQENLRNLIKNNQFASLFNLNQEELDIYKDSRELVYNDYRVCIKLHIPFCVSKDISLQNRYIKVLFNDVVKFVNEYRNKIYYGFEIEVENRISIENFNRLMFFSSQIIEFMQKSSDFDVNIKLNYQTIDKEIIKIIARNGFKNIGFSLPLIDRKIVNNTSKDCMELDNLNRVIEWCNDYNIQNISVEIDCENKDNIKDYLTLIKQFKPIHVLLKNSENNAKFNKNYAFLYKKMQKLGYYCSFGQKSFSLNNIDLGVSAYARNIILNNVSYKNFGLSLQSKTEEGITYNSKLKNEDINKLLYIDTFKTGDNYYLSKDILFNLYLKESVYCNQFNLQIMEKILEQSPLEKYNEIFNYLQKKKYIIIKENLVYFTKKGFRYKNAILLLFYPENQ